MNDSVGFAPLVLLDDGFGLLDFGIAVDPEGGTVIGGAPVGAAPHPASAAMIISAQLTGSARRSPLARRTAPRSPSDSPHEPVGGQSSPDTRVVASR
ncbi:MAG TPA: hypothetical protein VI036_06215 [Propionibacteriaceae bacterium]